MPKEIMKCRVCDKEPLVGWYGLCEDCHNATVDFWRIRKQQVKQRVLDLAHAAEVKKAREEAAQRATETKS